MSRTQTYSSIFHHVHHCPDHREPPPIPHMVSSHIIILLILCLSSLSSSVPLADTCGVISCPSSELRPSGCVNASQDPTLGTLEQLRRSTNLGRNVSKIKGESVNIYSRGNPVCYYISGASGEAFLSSESMISQRFTLPKGTYTFHWQFVHTEAAFAAAESKS